MTLLVKTHFIMSVGLLNKKRTEITMTLQWFTFVKARFSIVGIFIKKEKSHIIIILSMSSMLYYSIVIDR